MSSLARGSAVAAGMLAAAAAGVALTRPGRAGLAGAITGSRPRRRVGKHRRPPAARWQGWYVAAVRDWRGGRTAGARRITGGVTAACTGGALAGQARIGDCRGVPGPAGHGGRTQDHLGPVHSGPVRVGTAHGGLTDGGLTDGGLTDGGLTDGGLTDGGLTDGGLTDSGLTSRPAPVAAAA